jgi:hypothetical protein
MSHHIDELAKSLAEKPIPRRHAFRLFGAALAGALLAPFAVGTARAGPDPCRAACRCRNKRQQDACLAACHACGGDTNRMCGVCGSIVCCDEPDPYEEGACVNGQCAYWCVDGAAACGGGPCTPLWLDPDNCGACGNVCPDTAPVCIDGVCSPNPCYPLTYCNGICVNLLGDMKNCGACGAICHGNYCAYGICEGSYPPG